jgi:hypothetical protein
MGNHLTTKSFVMDLLNNHIKQTDPHEVMNIVLDYLKQYALKTNVYGRSEVYNKREVDNIAKPFVKTDGTTPFMAPQSGVTPKTD